MLSLPGLEHSAKNCGLDFKCVKCTASHAPGQFPRTSREGNAKCVNCDGDHPANSRQCQAFKAYEANVARRAPAPRRSFISTPAPWRNAQQLNSDFPQIQTQALIEEIEEIHPLVSFTQNPTSSENSRSSRKTNPSKSSFAYAQGRFRSIPDIDITMNMFNSLIDELSATTLHHERLQIMMRYCLPSASNNAP